MNLLALAAANGQMSTLDPTIAALLGDIRGAVSGGSVSTIDANLDRFRFNVATESLRRYPTVRVDYNITDKHRFSSAFNYQYFYRFPGHPEQPRGDVPRLPGERQAELRALGLAIHCGPRWAPIS